MHGGYESYISSPRDILPCHAVCPLGYLPTRDSQPRGVCQTLEQDLGYH